MLRLLNFQNVFTAVFTLLFMALMIHMGFLTTFLQFQSPGDFALVTLLYAV